MIRDIIAGLWLGLVACLLLAVVAGPAGCRTALQVQTRVYECHQEVREGGSVTLRDCKVQDDDQAEGAPASDQAGDDAVDVDATDDQGGAAVRAVVSPVAVAVVRSARPSSAAVAGGAPPPVALPATPRPATAGKPRTRPRRRINLLRRAAPGRRRKPYHKPSAGRAKKRMVRVRGYRVAGYLRRARARH